MRALICHLFSMSSNPIFSNANESLTLVCLFTIQNHRIAQDDVRFSSCKTLVDNSKCSVKDALGTLYDCSIFLYSKIWTSHSVPFQSSYSKHK